MHAFLISILTVALSEIGDKTQLVALLLASRFRRPLPIIAGIITATLLNHALAGFLGGIAAAAIDPMVLRWLLGAVFIAMAFWALIPDRLDESAIGKHAAGGAFASSLICFFLAEMGDKTQIATAALAARFGTMLPVIVGTTIGLLIVDIPTVLFGHFFGDRLNPRWVRYAAAGLFLLFGVLVFLGVELF